MRNENEIFNKDLKGNVVPDPSRRKFIMEGILAGVGAAIGVKGVKKLMEFGNKDEKVSEKEKTHAEILEERIDAVKADLKYIQDEINLEKNEENYSEQMKVNVDKWLNDVNYISNSISDKPEPASMNVISGQLEEIEKAISIERLSLERGMHLKA